MIESKTSITYLLFTPTPQVNFVFSEFSLSLLKLLQGEHKA
jgi:hypothetical protein